MAEHSKMDPSTGRVRPEYAAYYNMKNRCNNPESQRYGDYGARGISVCAAWMNGFDAFMDDMGPRPAGMSLERIDNEQGYCKENCIWATDTTQARNRRTTFLTLEKAREIREAKGSTKEVAEIWGITRQHCRLIRKELIWKEAA